MPSSSNIVVAAVFAAAVTVLLVSCREVHPYEPASGPVSGYELRGRVTAANGVAIESVAVSLDYDFEIIAPTPLDTIPFVEPNPPKVIQVDAYDYLGRHVRQIYFGVLPAGPVSRFNWTGFDDNNQPVPSGKYQVRYQLGDSVVKIVPTLIRRHVTTFTDESGNFVIKNATLPVGQVFDMYSVNTGVFLGAARVTETVYLLFQRSTLSRSATATLQPNNAYNGAFVLE